jgi:hypothetical protein
VSQRITAEGARPADTYRAARRNQRRHGAVWDGGIEARYVPHQIKPPVPVFHVGPDGRRCFVGMQERPQPKVYPARPARS